MSFLLLAYKLVFNSFAMARIRRKKKEKSFWVFEIKALI